MGELGIFKEIQETGFYNYLKNAIHYKTYLLLHETFRKLTVDIFKGIEVAKPFYIYGNEHDCEAINIYVFE